MKGSVKTKLDELAYERDGYKCAECGNADGIEAHHPTYIEDLDNLVTLCHACHKKRHDMGGCFVEGFDERRNIGALALALGSPKGHTFRGNQYIKV